ncbi:MAG: bifunctional [glutamine synthetase] adenylyltransferase/[glutamine synthetase]-adenylyl-L-tyrosine phosphorylase [Actinomycetota bacterium]|nr:bifunctional [glutamine synthetase] adenylyltransferase/[glutamine synthetase]-adenylyl-L-tyrosine phosphorylase [Actinomycetota bacterium]
MSEAGGRRISLASRLARLGVVDIERAEQILQRPAVALVLDQPDSATDLLAGLSGVADPDLSLVMLERFFEHCGPAAKALFHSDQDFRGRLLDVLGMSEALGDFLVRHPEQFDVLADGEALSRAPIGIEVRSRLLLSVGADPSNALMRARDDSTTTLDSLRIAYRRELLGIASRDLSQLAPMKLVATWLSDLADAVLEAGVAIARAGLPKDAADCRFAVIGMGKCGGRELNYVSDVDVIFVAEAVDGEEELAMRTANLLATGLMRACNESTREGRIWEVDPNLRPEGRQGALVRTIDSHVEYYERWAKTWEFQALLKARPAAGDHILGEQYVEAISPFVWSAVEREGFVEDAQAMRRRVEANVPSRIGVRELKLAPGGLRDVEFAVQLLQLVHGRSDVLIRSRTTLVALEALATWGYVGRADASTLGEAYSFLRALEHRLQLFRLRRTHTMPDTEIELRRLGRSMGFRSDPVNELITVWKRHAREVRRLHEKLFYRPLLLAVARLDAGSARLTPQAAEERLRVLGYQDPPGALRHIEALTVGVSRRASIQRTLLPVLLGWFANAPEPDGGLLGFRRVSEALGSTHWYLGLLRDESAAAERMAQLLASSRYATDLLLRAPDSVAMLVDDHELTPRTRASLVAEVQSSVGRYEDPDSAVAAVRALRRRELFRISAAQLLHLSDVDAVERALTDVSAATLVGALEVSLAVVATEYEGPLPFAFAVIAMGRFGGHELGLGSDVDVMFVYEPYDGADPETAGRLAFQVANDLRRRLMAQSNDPQLIIDNDLRPEGRQGPLVRTLHSYAAYYARWSAGWESQALLRAEFVAGDEALGARFASVIAPLRYPEGGLQPEQVREIRRLKARMEAERLPRGADPHLHTKLGRGGLSDVEWVAQLLQLQHAFEFPGLRTTRTLEALEAACAAGLIGRDDVDALRTAWQFAARIRDAVMLVRAHASDLVPTDIRELRGIAYVLGYGTEDSGRVLEDYQRITRRARKVMERLFYDAQ